MEATTRIEYDEDNRPLNLPETEWLGLFGYDGCDAVGPIVGNWCTTVEEWADSNNGMIHWHPTHYFDLPDNPNQSYPEPTYDNRVV